MNDKTFTLQLQEQLENGRPMIVENVPQDIDPVVDPILEKQVNRSGRVAIIKVDGQDMTWTDQFTFFMTTKLPNPSFTPELFAKCLVIDFTVTMQGLEQRLLSQVIGREKANLTRNLQAVRGHQQQREAP